MPTDKPEQQRQANDDLLIMTADGDMYLDPHVRQVMGLLVSDVNQWALPLANTSNFYTFNWPDQQPTKSHSVFIYRSDPPAPGSLEDSGMLMNRVLRTVLNLSEMGHWKVYKPLTQRVNDLWKYMAFVIMTAAFCLISYNMFQNSQELAAEKLRIETERMAAPASEVTLTDDEIKKLIAEETERRRGAAATSTEGVVSTPDQTQPTESGP